MKLLKADKIRLRSMSKRLYVLVIAIAVIVSLSGCYFFPKEEEVLAPPISIPDKITYETIEARRGNIENTIRCQGAFVSVLQRDLYYKDRGGRLREIYVTPGDKVKKGELLADLETDTIVNDIKLQEIALKRAQLVYDNAKTRYEIEGGSRTELDMAELDLQANKIRLENLKTELERTRLVSPVDGHVVYMTDIKLGEYINAHQTVVRIADPTELRLQYSGDDVNVFKLGMKTKVDAEKDEYVGEVVMTPSDMPNDADDTMKRSVLLKVDGLSEDVTIGTTAVIRHTLEKQDGVIIIPKQVVNHFGDRTFVNVLKDDIREERDIEVGIQNNTEVEVVKGLEEGELIIVR